MSDIVEEIRTAYATLGIVLEGPATYGTYFRLRCGRCQTLLGAVGDRLLPGMAAELLRSRRELYAQGLLGCRCGYQAERAGAGAP